MREEFIESFKALSLDDKRNQLNNEMESSYRMLQVIKQTINCPTQRDEQIRNYHMANDADLTEEEMLEYLYFDFYVIQRNILDIADTLIRERQQ